MKNIVPESTQLIADSYNSYRHSVCSYAYYKIGNKEDAEDISQEVFLRLMDYKRLLCPETIKSFIYTITRNLIIDYLRRYYKMQELTPYLYDCADTSVENTDSAIIANDILNCERQRLSMLPLQRRRIYTLSRFGDKSAQEISQLLGLSVRTVEGHLFISRKEIREYIKWCI